MKPNEIIDIATKGESKVVFQITGEDLMNLLRYIAKDSNKGENILHTAEREHMYAVLCTTVRELYDAGKISVRTLRGLIDHNITTLGALCQTTPKELTKFRNFGHISCEEAKDLLHENGLDFGMDVKQYGYPKIEWQPRRHQYEFVRL